MADQIDSLTIKDGISGPMRDAADAMNRAADAADRVEQSTTKAGRSAQSWANAVDPVTRTTKAYEKAVRDLADAKVAFGTAADKNQAVVEREGATLAALQSKVDSTRQAMLAAREGVSQFSKTTDEFAGSSKAAGLAVRDLGLQSIDFFQGIATGQPIMRSFIQQGAQVYQVNQQMGVGFRQLGSAVLGALGPFGTLPGIVGVTAVAALVGFGAAAEVAERRSLALQTALKATRDDYVSIAAEAEAAARAVANTTGVSTSDARAAAGTIVKAPQFAGTQGQLESLIRTADDLAAVMGTTVPDAAQKLTAAMADPAKLAQELADKDFKGFNTALVENVTHLANSGDKAHAFGVVLQQLQSDARGAANGMKTELQKALDDLANSLNSVGLEGKGLGDILGKLGQDFFTEGAKRLATTVEELKTVFDAIKSAYTGTVNFFTSGNPGGISGAAADQIHMIGQRDLNLPTNIVDFGTRVAAAETGGRHVDTNGNIITSKSGAVGEFQLMPGTASGLGVNPYDQTENIAGGLTYIAQLWKKYGGNPGLVAMAYNLGPGATDAFLAGTKTLADIPKETRDYVQKVAGVDVSSLAPGAGAAVIDVSGAGTGGTRNDPNAVRTLANDYAKQLGASGFAAGTAMDQIKALQEAIRNGGTTEELARWNEALQKAQLNLQNALGPAAILLRNIGDQISGEQEIGAAYAKGSAAVAEATIHVKAEADARQIAARTGADYKTVLQALTEQYTALNAQQQTNAGFAQEAQNNRSIEYLKAEMSTLGESADVRARELAMLQQKQQIEAQFPLMADEEKKKLIEQAGAVADLTAQYQRQQDALNEIGNMVTQVADQLGNALTQAFVSGQGAAVNFGNVAKAVLASVLQEVLKLAVINPILNSITGSSRSTLGDVVSAVGGSSGGGSSGGGGLLSTGSNLLSLGKSIFNGGSFSTGIGAVDSVLATPILGTGALTDATTSALSSMGGAFGPATAAQVGLPGVSIGGLLGGAGLGFGAGTLLGNLAGFKNSTGTMIGSGVGSLAGAAIGSIVPGVGTLVGGLLGGLLGSTGGLFGPPPKNEFSTTQVDVGPDGLLHLGTTDSQLAQNGQTVSAAQGSINDLNALLTGNNIRVANAYSSPSNQFDDAGLIGRFGYDKGSNSTLGNAGADFSSIFPMLQFDLSGSARPELQKVFNGRTGFTDSAQLGAVIGTLSGLSDDIKNHAPDAWQHLFDVLANTPTSELQAKAQQIDQFVTQTVPALENFSKVTGSLNDQIGQINATFDPAIQTAQQLGYAEDKLTQARQAAIDKANAAAAYAGDQTLRGIFGRQLTAQAVTPQEQEAAALYNFDTQAAAQRHDFQEQVRSAYGDAALATQAYADQAAQLERTLGAERLAIQKQYDDQITQQSEQAAQAAGQAVTSLSSYLQKLQFGSASALSPTDQYSLASRQFDAVAGAAAAGDYNSIANLPSYADSFLSASQAVNGSGAGYAADFNRVTTAVSQVASLPAGALTASVFSAETRTQTQTLVDELRQLRASVDQLRASPSLNAPTRYAA